MATGKKYFWIKLKDSFMTSDTVDYFMSQPNGANYVVLYQMLCLKTINTEGHLSRQIGEVIIPYDIGKIKRDCKWFSEDTIRVALKLYESFGLIYEDSDGTLVLTDHANLVGMETDFADQKRKQRALTVDNVHTDVHSNVHQNVHTEIRDQRLDNRDQRLDNRDQRLEILTVSDETVRLTEVRRVLESWNELQQFGIKPVRGVATGSKRQSNLHARIRQYGVETVVEAIEKIKHSDFLQGKNSNGWTIVFDWFLLPTNFQKVLEGNYEGQSRKGKYDDVSNPFLQMLMKEENDEQKRDAENTCGT